MVWERSEGDVGRVRVMWGGVRVICRKSEGGVAEEWGKSEGE